MLSKNQHLKIQEQSQYSKEEIRISFQLKKSCISGFCSVFVANVQDHKNGQTPENPRIQTPNASAWTQTSTVLLKSISLVLLVQERPIAVVSLENISKLVWNFSLQKLLPINGAMIIEITHTCTPHRGWGGHNTSFFLDGYFQKFPETDTSGGYSLSALCGALAAMRNT